MRDALAQGVMHSFPCTLNGWVWYCDGHDTHGNADTEDEARHMAAAHQDYIAGIEDDEDDDSGDIEISCEGAMFVAHYVNGVRVGLIHTVDFFGQGS